MYLYEVHTMCQEERRRFRVPLHTPSEINSSGKFKFVSAYYNASCSSLCSRLFLINSPAMFASNESVDWFITVA